MSEGKICPIMFAIAPVTMTLAKTLGEADQSKLETIGNSARCAKKGCQLWDEYREDCGLKVVRLRF